MANNDDVIALYSKRILALAAAIPHIKPFCDSMSVAKARSPLCGSYINVGLIMRDGLITDFAQDVKACALGQASAAIFGQVVIGLDKNTIQIGRAQLHQMLSDAQSVPDAPFDGYEILDVAKEFKNRHASILLPFDATLLAM